MFNTIDCIVVSGGSIRGFGLLGAIQYVIENYKGDFETINTFIGTSIGSIICYLLSIGYFPLEIIHQINKTDILTTLTKNIDITTIFNTQGIISLETLLEEVELMTLVKYDKIFTFKTLYEELGKEFVCITYNYTKQRQEILHYTTTPDLPCITGLKMSSSIPFIFERCIINDNTYIDGGLADNFSIRTALKLNKKNIIGFVSRPTDAQRNPELEGLATFFQKVVFTPMIEATRKTIKKYKKKKYSNRIQIVDLDIPQHFLNFGIDMAEIMNMFSDGYNTTRNKLNPL